MRGPAMMPQTCVFLPKQTMSGVTPKCSKAHILPVAPNPVCTSSKISRASCRSASSRSRARNSGRKWLSPPSPWIGSRMMPAMSCGCWAKACSISAQALSLFRGDARDLLRGDRKTQLRVGDPRPVELGEVLDLQRLGVGQRHRVAGPAVERLLEVQDLGAELAAAGRQVLADLPVEGCLQGVLDCQRAAVDQEQILEGRSHRRAPEGVDKVRELGGVGVGVRRFAERRAEEALLGRLGLQRRVAEAQGQAGEEAVEVQVLRARDGVDDPAAVALGEVEGDRNAIGDHVLGDGVVNVTGRGRGHGGFLSGGGQVRARPATAGMPGGRGLRTLRGWPGLSGWPPPLPCGRSRP